VNQNSSHLVAYQIVPNMQAMVVFLEKGSNYNSIGCESQMLKLYSNACIPMELQLLPLALMFLAISSLMEGDGGR